MANLLSIVMLALLLSIDASAGTPALTPQMSNKISKAEYLKLRSEVQLERPSRKEVSKEKFEKGRQARKNQCLKNSKSFECKYQDTRDVVAGQYFTLKNRISMWASSMWANARALTFYIGDKSQSLVSGVFKAKTTGTPPEAGGIFSENVGGQERPQVRLATLSDMVDADGTIEKVVWDFGDGTKMEIPREEINIRAEVIHYYSVPAHYYIGLSIYDNDGNVTSYASYAETDYNPAPLPTFEVSVTHGAAPLAVTFTSTGVDPTGEAITYSWDFDDGATSNTAIANHTFTDPGIYEVKLKIKDSSLAASSATVTIYVDETPPNVGTEPTGIILTDETFGEAPFTVNFDASSSFDADGTIASYRWDFGDYDSAFNFSQNAKASHTYQVPGTYSATLILTDEDGAESFHTVAIHVAGPQILPPQIMARQRSSNPLQISFDGNERSLRSTTEEAGIWWDFGDGSTVAAQRGPVHTYSTAGTYTVTLNVLDVQGVRHSITKDITIGAEVDKPAVAMNLSKQSVQLNEFISFDGENSVDTEGGLPLTYRWDFGDGEQIVSTNPQAWHRFETQGSFYVQLAVTNTRGISSRSTRVVNVSSGTPLLADLRYSPKVGIAPLTVDFDGSNSKSAMGKIEEWNLSIDGVDLISKDPVSEYTFEDVGQYFISFAVRDSLGNTGNADKEILVVDSGEIPGGNAPPVAAMLVDGYQQNPLKYYFDCWDSTDPDLDDYIFSCDWKINGVALQDGFGFDHVFPEPGRYTIELTVTDNWGASSKLVKQLDLTGNTVPIALFDHSPLKPIPTELVRFSAEGSVVPNQQIVTYAWNFGDSSTAQGLNVTHTYASAGTYTVTLTLTDDESETYTYTKNVVVAAAANPTLKVTIQDAELGLSPSVTAFTSDMGTVHFSVRETTNSVGTLRNAVWSFGDGQTAYGLDVENTYFRPGSYTATVTAYDVDGRHSNASRTITLTNDGCKTEKGQHICLSSANSAQHIMSMFDDYFTVDQNPFEVDFEGASFPVFQLESLDGRDKIIALSGAVGDMDRIDIPMADIKANKEIDLAVPYRLTVVAKLSTSEKEMMQLPEFYFGSSHLRITVSDYPAKVQFVHTGAQLRHAFDFTNTDPAEYVGMPAGNITIIGERNGKSVIQNIWLDPKKTVNVNLDLSNDALSISNKKLTKALPKPVNAFSLWKREEAKILKSKVSKDKGSEDGLCGESSPFPPTIPRSSGEGQERIWKFSSYSPMEQSDFRSIPRRMRNPVRLSCSIASDSLMYGYAKWKYKEGPSRCWETGGAEQYWSWFLNRLKRETEPTVVKYEVRDAWTGESYINHFVTSPHDVMRKKGMSLNDLTWQIGIPTDENIDWGLRAEYDITIPPQYKRPEIRFELHAPNPSGANGLYVVDCDVTDTSSIPSISNVTSTEMGTAGRQQANGLNSLQKRFGMFPVHFDNNAGSPVSSQAELAKVAYEVEIQSQDRSDITWQGVQVEWKYGQSVFTKLYEFPGSGVVNSVNRTYRNYFVIDTEEVAENLSAPIQWSAADEAVSLKIKPVGKITEDHDFVGQGKVLYFKAMFDIRTLQSSLFPQLCSNGFFGSNLSTFAQNSTVRMLLDAGAQGAALRCGDFSLPFGGDFISTAKTLNGHRDGRTGEIRSFNTDSTTQDSYDDFSGLAPRLEDVESYIEFSDAAKAISELPTHGPMNDRRRVYDSCMEGPLPPCTDVTSLNEMNHEMVLAICERHGTDVEPVEGCPTLPLEGAVRFANWVKQNALSFKILRMSSFTGSMAEGVGLLASPYADFAWQKEALVNGLWPDGFPIFVPTETGNRFTDQKIMSCHGPGAGCQNLNSLFSRDQTILDVIPFKAGWRY